MTTCFSKLPVWCRRFSDWLKIALEWHPWLCNLPYCIDDFTAPQYLDAASNSSRSLFQSDDYLEIPLIAFPWKSGAHELVFLARLLDEHIKRRRLGNVSLLDTLVLRIWEVQGKSTAELHASCLCCSCLTCPRVETQFCNPIKMSTDSSESSGCAWG